MRGDHDSTTSMKPSSRGTSPHARGPQNADVYAYLSRRNIPACAGTTRHFEGKSHHVGEHPRMRGDHASALSLTACISGTSPHARGPQVPAVGFDQLFGNIPACAGTTQRILLRRARDQEHPRMRGDHSTSSTTTPSPSGTSPHARGPLDGERCPAVAQGNIPACAGTTTTAGSMWPITGEHPRMRGDHAPEADYVVVYMGTSPHARGPLHFLNDNAVSVGNIPACAGTTRWRALPSCGAGEHPRMRGDHGVDAGVRAVRRGTSPHARGPLLFPQRRV